MINKKIVLVFGVFDYFHPGHQWFLKKARQYGEYLCVVLAEDGVVKKIKGEAPTRSWNTRKKILLASGLVDSVRHGDRTLGAWTSLRQLQPTVIVTGYDQTALRQSLRAWRRSTKNNSFRIVRLSGTHTKIWKSSIMKHSALPA